MPVPYKSRRKDPKRVGGYFAVRIASAMALLSAPGSRPDAIARERSIYPSTGVTGSASPNRIKSFGERCLRFGLRVPLAERLARRFLAFIGFLRCQTALTPSTSPTNTLSFALSCESLLRGMLPYLFSLTFLGFKRAWLLSLCSPPNSNGSR